MRNWKNTGLSYRNHFNMENTEQLLVVKNMVCPRCVLAVENLLKRMEIDFEKVVLGRVSLKNPLKAARLTQFENELNSLGFEILKNRDVKRVEEIKNLLYLVFQKEEIPTGFNLMDYISEAIPEDYSRLSHLFSSMEGITLERFFINLKIEKVKEWLFYEELQLSEMAWKLGYSSVQHLSSQFKKITGMTPSAFKKLKKSNSTGWKS